MSLDDYLDHARREMFPKMKASAISIVCAGEPDPKLCLELGAAIMFDKPIIVLAPPGCKIPLSLRTIAHKVIEDVKPNDADSARRIQSAMQELMEVWKFRKG
jgi:hypothetical protein